MPLKVVRSLEAIVFEQATIDRVIRSVGVDPRTARTAVLRGDNPRDIEVSPNPECEVIDARPHHGHERECAVGNQRRAHRQ